MIQTDCVLYAPAASDCLQGSCPICHDYSSTPLPLSLADMDLCFSVCFILKNLPCNSVCLWFQSNWLIIWNCFLLLKTEDQWWLTYFYCRLKRKELKSISYLITLSCSDQSKLHTRCYWRKHSAACSHGKGDLTWQIHLHLSTDNWLGSRRKDWVWIQKMFLMISPGAHQDYLWKWKSLWDTSL